MKQSQTSIIKERQQSCDNQIQKQQREKLNKSLKHRQSFFKQFDNLDPESLSMKKSVSANNLKISFSLLKYNDESQINILDSIQQQSESRLSRGLSLFQQNHQFLQSIQFSSFQRWTLLIISVFCNAVVPCWMTVDINCEGITRSAWRIFTLSILLIPFVLNEQREIIKAEQKFMNLMKKAYLQQIYIGSINYCVWAVFGVLATKITSRAHSFCFLRLRFFLVTIKKIYNQSQCHQGQIGGLILTSIGLLMMIWDSFSLPVENVPSIYYLSCLWWQRALGDLLAVIGCVLLFILQSRYQLPKGPRFTNLFLYNIFISMNLVITGYYFGGNEFSFDPKIGVFGIFTSQNFVSVFYVSIMLGLNLIIANVLVNRIFSEYIRNVASCFEIIITVTVQHIFSIQRISAGISALGLSFLVPGMMMIVGGQSSLKKLQIRINSQIYETNINTSYRRKNAFVMVSNQTEEDILKNQKISIVDKNQGEENVVKSVSSLKQKKQ